MPTRSLTTSAACKHCGATVIIEVTNIPIDMPEYQGRMGGVTSKPCPKCHKASQYTFEIKGGQFTRLR